MTPLLALPVVILAVGLVATVMAAQRLGSATGALRDQLLMLGRIRTEVDGLRAEATQARTSAPDLAEHRRAARYN